jgi:deoxycytidylate deaminase
MINLADAEQIVDDCIVVAVGYSGVINAEDKLSDVGVKDDIAVFALRDAVVNNPTKGVPKKNHQIDPNDLNFGTDSTVADVRDLVHKYATPKGGH